MKKELLKDLILPGFWLLVFIIFSKNQNTDHKQNIPAKLINNNSTELTMERTVLIGNITHK